MARVRFTTRKGISEFAKSGELASILEGVAGPVYSAALRDPNAYYVSTLQMRRYTTGGRAGRVSIQIGAEPRIGARVEATRGTLARAMGNAGL